jgi:cell division protein FtsL
MRKITKYIIGFLVMVAITTQIAKIYVSNTAALDSIEAAKLEAEVSKVSESNMELKSKVLALSSYQNVASKAAGLGFVESRDIVSVYDPVKVAIGR